MKTEKWVLASDDTSEQIPVPKSGPYHGLAGYDASNRPVANSRGVLLTPRILARDKSRIKEKPHVEMMKASGLPPVTPKSGSKVATNKMRPNSKKSLGAKHI